MNNAFEKNQTPKLKSIYFYLTRDCNCACRHCYLSAHPSTIESKINRLNLGLFKKIIEEAKDLGAASVKLSGGEPFLHPEIVDFINCHEMDINIETNGTLCTEELARCIAKNENAFVSISIDGSNEYTHDWIRRLNGGFKLALQGIERLVKNKITTQIIMTIMNRNHTEIEQIIHLAENVGVGSIKFNILQPTGGGGDSHNRGEALSVAEYIGLGHWIENVLSKKTDIFLNYSYPSVFCSLSSMFESPGQGRCDVLHIIGVLHNGFYSLCGVGEICPELVFGNANIDNLKDVWENASLLNEIRVGIPERLGGACQTCVMLHLCQGACIAHNYSIDPKSVWNGHWFCEEAKKMGLFPETRKNVPKKR